MHRPVRRPLRRSHRDEVYTLPPDSQAYRAIFNAVVAGDLMLNGLELETVSLTQLDQTGLELDDVDLVVAHQANDRILDGVRRQFGLGPEKVPSNIGAYGNTTAGTLPILYHELVSDGRIRPGQLICFTALGSGLHWGAAPRERASRRRISAASAMPSRRVRRRSARLWPRSRSMTM